MTYHLPCSSKTSPLAIARPNRWVKLLRVSKWCGAISSPHSFFASLRFAEASLCRLLGVLFMHTLYFNYTRFVKSFFVGKSHTDEYNALDMRKAAALSFRIPRRLKAELEKVALQEGRSLSQVCEALLGGGLEAYRKEGPKYLQRFLFRQKKEDTQQ